MASGFCRSQAELRVLLREDLAFQRCVLEGRDPAWVFGNWHVTDRRLTRQRLSWALTVILARHAHIGAFIGMLACILVPGWLAAMIWKRLKGVSDISHGKSLCV